MRTTLIVAAYACAITAFVVVAARAQMPAPQPSLEDRLDQCNAERGALLTESARLNYQVREAGKVLASDGFEMKDGRWAKKVVEKKDEPKK